MLHPHQARGLTTSSEQPPVRARVPQPARFHITFNHLSPAIIAKVVEKFVLQLEAQLADRDVTIELSDEAAKVVDRARIRPADGGAADGPRHQETSRAAADEVRVGKLKNAAMCGGGTKEESGEGDAGDKSAQDKLAFEFLRARDSEAEKIPPVRPKSKRRGGGGGGGGGPKQRAKPPGPRGDGGPRRRAGGGAEDSVVRCRCAGSKARSRSF